jgi:hypothetical protein
MELKQDKECADMKVFQKKFNLINLIKFIFQKNLGEFTKRMAYLEEIQEMKMADFKVFKNKFNLIKCIIKNLYSRTIWRNLQRWKRSTKRKWPS